MLTFKNKYFEHDYDQAVDNKIQGRYRKALRYDAIHMLARFSNETRQKITQSSSKLIAQNDIYQDFLDQYGKMIIGEDGNRVMNLNIEFASEFNPLYYTHFIHHNETIRRFIELYSNKEMTRNNLKATENDPLSIFNVTLGFYMAMVRESFMKTQIIFFINLLKYRDYHEFIDADMLSFAIQIIKVLVEYALMIKSQGHKEDFIKDLEIIIQDNYDMLSKLKRKDIKLVDLVTKFVGKENIDNKPNDVKPKDDFKEPLPRKGKPYDYQPKPDTQDMNMAPQTLGLGDFEMDDSVGNNAGSVDDDDDEGEESSI